MRRTIAGDDSAFEILVRRYRRAATACALAIVRDQAEADDVAHDAMVQAYQQLASLRTPGRFASWLLVAVRRRALNAVRAARRRRQAPLDPALRAPDGDRPDERFARHAMRARLEAALDTLPPVWREVVLLADAGDRSHADIAEILGISIAMSRRHLSDARRLLRERLPSPGAEHEP